MRLKLIRSNCICLGSFNIYIVQPKWLADQGIIPRSIEVAIEANLEEPGFRFSSPALSSRWMLHPSRLAIETDDPREDCGAFMGKVLERLPYTPLIALGKNFDYLAEETSPDELKWFEDDSSLSLPRSFKRKASSRGWSFQKGSHLFNLNVVRDDKGTWFRMNIHTELRGREIESALESANLFKKHRTASKGLMNRMFGSGGAE